MVFLLGKWRTAKRPLAPASIGVTGRSSNICKAGACDSRHHLEAYSMAIAEDDMLVARATAALLPQCLVMLGSEYL
ncbi:hypothetical protein KCU73_g139, partial [Aureobasidium melanogenum]